MLAFFFGLCCLVVDNYYNGSLLAFLTVKRGPKLINSMEHLASLPGVRTGFFSVPIHADMRMSSNKAYNVLAKKRLAFSGRDEALNLLVEGNFALLDSRLTLEYVARQVLVATVKRC